MKVYIVKAPQGEYESYEEPIVKVFLDKKKAKQYVKDENAKLPLEQADMCFKCLFKWDNCKLRTNKSHNVVIGTNIKIVKVISSITIFKHYLLKNMRWKMNNIYFDKLPERIVKSSNEDDVHTTEVRMWFKSDVKISPISDRLAKERKKVCDYLRKELNIRPNHPYISIDLVSQENFFQNLLEQVEKGESNVKD